ncbi:MAG TPA: HypC/HybG/HupF family hydrogenase formation chaperone [Clostridia bacterium]
MCLAIPGKIIEIKGQIAEVDILGAIRDVSVELLSDVKIGDFILVHAGCAISKLNEEEAIETIKIFEELKEL